MHKIKAYKLSDIKITYIIKKELYIHKNVYEIYVYKKYPTVPVTISLARNDPLFKKYNEIKRRGIPTIRVNKSDALP